MMNSLVITFRFITRNFRIFLLCFILVIVFLFILFPFGDLNDLISIQVSKLTQNKIFLQFENMTLNPLTASVSLEKVFVEAPQISSLSVDEISLTPSIPALIASKPGGVFKAHGFLKGDVEVHLSPTSSDSPSKNANAKPDQKSDKYKIDLSAQNLNLKDLRELVGLNLPPFTGKINLNSQAIADLSFIEQPEGDVTILIQKFELPASTISLVDLGRLNLPEIKWGQVELKGKLNNGKFLIETGKIGTAKDDFYGDIKGDLGLTFQNYGGQIVPLLGAYSLTVEMKATAAFKEKAKFFLSFLDLYKKDLPDGTQYKFKIQASAFGVNANLTPLQ